MSAPPPVPYLPTSHPNLPSTSAIQNIPELAHIRHSPQPCPRPAINHTYTHTLLSYQAHGHRLLSLSTPPIISHRHAPNLLKLLPFFPSLCDPPAHQPTDRSNTSLVWSLPSTHLPRPPPHTPNSFPCPVTPNTPAHSLARSLARPPPVRAAPLPTSAHLGRVT